jgi:hypothetical protein
MFAESYDRMALSFHRMNRYDQNNMPILNDLEFCFGKDHPGRCFCCVKNSKKIRAPKISMSKGMNFDLKHLNLSEENPSIQALQNEENYANEVQTLFYPLYFFLSQR